MHADSKALNDLSGRVIGCAFTVRNTLGAGFAEKVYENALAIELRTAGLTVALQCGVKVRHNDAVVGDYFPDLGDAHRMQCTNYVKATGLRLCLLLNFSKPRLENKRLVNGL